jgi:nucleoid-associated protein YgaU
MGLFDKMFGHHTAAAPAPDVQQQFNQLRDKYHTALTVADQQHIQFTNLHVEDGKLIIRGVAPSEDAKNAFWDQVKLVDSNYSDLVADISVQEQKKEDGQSQGETYTVQPGDTLSKIAKHFYGNANEYMRIFYANRDKLSDPDRIQVGQELTIPPAE